MKIAACFGVLLLAIAFVLLEPWHACRRHRPLTTISLTRSSCGWPRGYYSLKTIASAQADFRANDRDDNKIQDFWRGDISGLYGVLPAGSAEMIKLIELSVASADPASTGKQPIAATGPGQVALDHYATFAPKAGYFFIALRHADETPGSLNSDRFAACAYPAEYELTGVLTFIIDERNTIFKRDLEGRGPPDVFPDAETLERDWEKLD